MRVLAMDCSSAVGSLAIVDGNDVLFQKDFDCPRGRGTGVFEVLERAMGAVGAVHRIVVGIGPGTYNGLRVSVAVADGFALARSIEKVGLISLLGLDEGPDFWAAGDARGGKCFVARITGGLISGEIEVLPIQDAIAKIQHSGAKLPVFVPARMDALPHAVVRHPSARRLAFLGAAASPVAQLQPYYAKPVHITFPSGSGRSPWAGANPSRGG